MITTKDLKTLLKEDKLIIGKDITFKSIKRGDLKRVVLSSNCPEEVLDDLEYYNKISPLTIERVDSSNEELGILCKKPFSVAVIGIKD